MKVRSLPGPFICVLQHTERDAVGFAQLCSSTASGLRSNMVCSIRLCFLCGGRSWQSSLTNSNSQQPDFPGHEEQPRTDLCDSDHKVLFPPVGNFLPMSHSDATVPPVYNPTCTMNISGQRITIVVSRVFCTAVSSWCATWKTLYQRERSDPKQR